MPGQFEVIIQGGRVVLPHGVERVDIGIRGGVIAAIAPGLIPDEHTLIYSGKDRIVFPGVVDAHVHFNEPGLAEWEGFTTGSAALAAGGITTYIDMPLNGVPPTTTRRGWECKQSAAADKSYVDYAFWGGLVPNNETELSFLAEVGAAGFKAFMSEPGGEGEEIFTRTDDKALIRGMTIIAELGGVLALHAESDEMTNALAFARISSGKVGAEDYLASRPPEAETEAVSRAIVYARETGCKLHFVHISTRRSVDLIKEAKRSGLDITVETCPHYLVLTEDDVLKLGAVAKCAPPLRNKEEQELLWEALLSGDIDLIASDHSPCPPDMKDTDNFFHIWGGIAGAQSTLLLMLEEGHVRRNVPLTLIASLLASEPARRFGLDTSKGEIAIGKDADFAIIDMNESYTLTREEIRYRHVISPYINRTFSCKVKATFSRGIQIYDDLHGLIDQRLGKFIPAVKQNTIVQGGDIYA
ncbi:allantoinase AllB [Paenibacillus sp. Marseille-Q4541]|uniref:allantoinase AllB n=1 Tax=Paenibacillus sp. Marseille-Q4541 TaxID=2831522 RepID=UPI001BAC7E62|nr:allantoinase AllB [Paenibacillus sp. Marseille-Q4541]